MTNWSKEMRKRDESRITTRCTDRDCTENKCGDGSGTIPSKDSRKKDKKKNIN